MDEAATIWEYRGFQVYQDEAGEYRWRKRDSGNEKIIADSGEGYEERDGVEEAIDNVISEIEEGASEPA